MRCCGISICNSTKSIVATPILALKVESQINMKNLIKNWQKILFAAFGFVPLFYSAVFLADGKIAEAGAAFGIAFLSFIYSNLTQFKRFKGLGFEAELWEDKQKEAEAIIDRLKNVVAIYSEQAVLNQIKQGRFTGVNWKENWALYEKIILQHSELGQQIDFSNLKKKADDYFLFDICLANVDKIRDSIRAGQNNAREKISSEFGTPIKDLKGYGERLNQLGEILDSPGKDLFEISQRENLAGKILSNAQHAKAKLKEYVEIEIEFDGQTVERLEHVKELYGNRPVDVTDELIKWTQ